MIVLGIVGGIGAGKTTVVSLLKEIKSTVIIGADEIGHELLLKDGKAYHQIVKTFGTHILDEQDNIVRSRLGNIIFSDDHARELLNQITHPLIFDEVRVRIEKYRQEEKNKWVIIDAALLIEIGLTKLCDEIVAVFAKEHIRCERICIREGYTKEEALKRIEAQKPWEDYEKVATKIIDNSESIEETKEQVRKIAYQW